MHVVPDAELSDQATSLNGRRKRSFRQNFSSNSENSCAELLVDADTHSIDEIRSGIELLRLEMGTVHTTIFAAPGLSQNTKWQKLFQEAGVSFRPVPRSSIHSGEPNDDAIMASIRQLCRSSAVTCLALLVSDSDYATVLQEALHSDKVVVAVCPAIKFSLMSKFQEMGIRALSLPQQRVGGPKIRAILDQGGGGHVYLAKAYRCEDVRKEWQEAEAVAEFLDQLGYRQEDSRYMIHQIANFWSTNALGPLTVYPNGIARKSVFELVEQGAPLHAMSWRKSQTRKAFFLPCTNRKRVSKTQANTFGSALACSIFEAGGPFLLQDSEDLVSQVLGKLGYLDSSLNNDLAEALLVFFNTTANKVSLRKLDALPSRHDPASTVQEVLRQVFLSDSCSGRWHMAPKDVLLREHLCREGFLRDVAADRTVVFEAMRNYAPMKSLPEMKSYIGYSFRITAGLNPNPTRRGLVEFQC